MTRTVRCPLGDLAEGTRELPEDARRYLTRVHRLGEGAAFVAFDPEAGVEADARISAVRAGSVRCTLGPVRTATNVSKLSVTLIQSLGKGDRVEQVVRDTTQLGVRRIVLVQTERSVVKWLKKGKDKQARYRSVALQSCRQCGRGDAPVLLGPLSLAEALQLVAHATLKLCLDVNAERTLRAELEERPLEGELAALVGPEGGLSAVELAEAERAGFDRVSLGPFTLRTETAAVAALAVLAQYS